MRYRVIETVTTPLHRFEAGIEVDEVEIHGPLPVSRWVEMGRLEAVNDMQPPPVAEAVKPVPEAEQAPPADAVAEPAAAAEPETH